MLRIDEDFKEGETVLLRLEGRLDRNTLLEVSRICNGYLQRGISINMNLEGIDHISKEGRDFLRNMKDKVQFCNLSEFLKIEIFQSF